MDRMILRAAPGMVLTDGKTYGKVIFLAGNANASAYYEITEAEYAAMMEKEGPDEV